MRHTRSMPAAVTSVFLLALAAAPAIEPAWPAPLFPSPVLDVGELPGAVVRGDFNGDGLPDLAVTNYGSFEVSIRLGRSDGSFSSEARFAVGPGPLAIAVADFDNDGRQDLAVANEGYYPDETYSVSVLLGRGDGTFAAEVRTAAGSSFMVTLAIGDFNRDGRTDVAVPDVQHDTVQVLLGNGDGTFAGPTAFGVGAAPTAAAAGDLNRDGVEDLVVTNAASGDVSVLLGRGNGAFGPESRQPYSGSLPITTLLADLDGDGILDLAVAARQSDSVGVLKGRGDGTFAGPVLYDTGDYPISVAAGDFNGDGSLDLATVNIRSDDLGVLLGDGRGGYAAPILQGVSDSPSDLVPVDYDRDGWLDLAVTVEGSEIRSNALHLLQGHGDGTFGPPRRPREGVGAGDLVVADLNGDGVVDAAVSNIYSWDVSILHGAGGGTFGEESRYAVGRYPGAMTAGDFNGDGAVDLVVANHPGLFSYGEPGDYSLLPGRGEGTFGTEIRFGTHSQARSLAAADFNGDGRLDLAAADVGVFPLSDPGHVAIYRGNGDGTFGAPTRLPAGNLPNFVVASDLNGDGRQDLAVTSGGHARYGLPAGVSVLLGHDDGTLAGFQVAGGVSPNAVSVADLNGDGIQDLAVADRGRLRYEGTYEPGSLFVLLGHGNGTFGPPAPAQTDLNPVSVMTADFDGDGRQDLAAINTSFDVSVLRGAGDGTFAPRSRYSAGGLARAAVARDISGDGRADLVVLTTRDLVSLLGRPPEKQEVSGIAISIGGEAGRAAGTLTWSTNREDDLLGFNVVVLTPRGDRIQQNEVLIPCEECVTGNGRSYLFTVPRHRGGRDLFIEMVHRDGRVETFGPAIRLVP